jgi:hypothetical protein
MSRHGEIAGRILDYFTTRLEEEDTLNGIINWWMRSNKGENDNFKICFKESKNSHFLKKKIIISNRIRITIASSSNSIRLFAISR